MSPEQQKQENKKIKQENIMRVTYIFKILNGVTVQDNQYFAQTV